MRNKYVFVTVLLTVLTVVSIWVSTIGTRIDKKEEEILIVTSFYPIYIAVLNVTDGVEAVRVECLAQPEAGCIHDQQLTTQDMRSLEQADLLIVNGAGMESYLDFAITSYPELDIVETVHGISLQESTDSHVHQKEGDKQEEELYNAHVWLDMDKYCIQIENIGNGLSKVDPTHAKQYEENVKRYQNKVREIKKECAELSNASSKTAVSTHEAFSYFAQNFEWTVVETINMDENTSLKPQEVSEIVEAVQRQDIPYVFTEEIYGDSLSHILKRETSAKPVVLNVLVTGSMEKDAYIEGMRKNIRMLKEVAVQ